MADTQNSEAQHSFSKAMSEIEKYQKGLVDQSHIIVFGQVQAKGEGFYLDTIEYLKTPKDYQTQDNLVFENGVKAGHNIPSLNTMALAFFAEDQTLIQIYKSSQGSPSYEIWRQHILASKELLNNPENAQPLK